MTSPTTPLLDRVFRRLYPRSTPLGTVELVCITIFNPMTPPTISSEGLVNVYGWELASDDVITLLGRTVKCTLLCVQMKWLAPKGFFWFQSVFDSTTNHALLDRQMEFWELAIDGEFGLGTSQENRQLLGARQPWWTALYIHTYMPQ